MSTSDTIRALILCDVRGRILAAMPAMPTADTRKKDSSRAGAAGIIATKGTRLHEIDVHTSLIGADGSMCALIEGFAIKTVKGPRGGSQLMKRSTRRAAAE